MPVRVELVADAFTDLDGLVASGNIMQFLAKLVRLEEMGKDAGLPLGSTLTGLRKITVGDRNWRMVFKMNAEDTVATVWVIGDRNDSACYEQAVRRLQSAGSRPEAVGFSAVILSILQRRLKKKKSKRKAK